MSWERCDTLQRSNISLATCSGCYYVDAFNYFADESSLNEILLYLVNCRLEYAPSNFKALQDRDNGNPWYYQPLRLATPFDKRFFGPADLRKFIEFLGANFGITLTFGECSEDEIIKRVEDQLKNRSIIVVMIDEYFNPHSKIHYKTNHNHHSLMVKGFCSATKELEVIDTEASGTYVLTFDDFLRSFKRNFKVLNCERFVKRIDYNKMFEQYLNNIQDCSIFKKFEKEVMCRLTEEAADLEYYLRGINFSITFQILPIVRMRCLLVEKLLSLINHDLQGLIESAQNIVVRWRRLSFIILRILHRKAWIFDEIERELHSLFQQECNINDKLSNIK